MAIMIAWLQACWLRERIVVLLYRVFVRPISHWHDDWPVYDWCENDCCSQAAAQPSQKRNSKKKAEATTESQRRTRRLEILIALRKMYRNVLRAQGLLSQPSPLYETSQQSMLSRMPTFSTLCLVLLTNEYSAIHSYHLSSVIRASWLQP